TSGSSAIVAINNKKEVYLVKQWRYALDRSSIELPWGGRKKNETNLQCAKRELREETGLIAKKWSLLSRSSICPGILNEQAYIYLATDVSQKGRIYIPEEGDQEVITIPFQQAYQWAISKRLLDAVTISGIFLAREKLGL
ncbi:MAG TPA: NUDIX hydrolase, partial [Desulfobacterales bacterium]|nr:NUDIX hydrolase [Desulfobacterales bacterium]